MNNIYKDHELVLKIGRELKPDEEHCTYIACIRCDVEVLPCLINPTDPISTGFAMLELDKPCILKRK